MERYLRVNLLGPGPRLMKKRIYRAAVSQRLRNTGLGHTASLSSAVSRIHHAAVILQPLKYLPRLFYSAMSRFQSVPQGWWWMRADHSGHQYYLQQPSLINIITHEILYLWLQRFRNCFFWGYVFIRKKTAFTYKNSVSRQTFTAVGNRSRWNFTAHYARLLWPWVRLSL